MIRTVLYQYMGTNGTILSPVHLEDIYYVRKIRLTAGDGKILTNGITFKTSVLIPEAEEKDWKEVANIGQI